MIEYFLIGALYFIGLFFHVMKRIGKVRVLHPEAKLSEVWGIYFQEEWNTLIVCAVCFFLIELMWFILHYEKIAIPDWIHEYGGVYGLALGCGYGLHRWIYSVLGTMDKAAETRFGINKD